MYVSPQLLSWNVDVGRRSDHDVAQGGGELVCPVIGVTLVGGDVSIASLDLTLLTKALMLTATLRLTPELIGCPVACLPVVPRRHSLKR